LGSGAPPSSASVSEEELQDFRDTYGHSAFTCRYAHCERASDGFGSHQEREKHEAQHRREYCCATPACAYSEMGFASRAQLNRHTRKYHAQFDDETSLADEVRALKKRRAAEEITKHKKTPSMSVREISPQFSSASGLSSPPRSSPELGSPSAQFANQSNRDQNSSMGTNLPSVMTEKPVRYKPGRKPGSVNAMNIEGAVYPASIAGPAAGDEMDLDLDFSLGPIDDDSFIDGLFAGVDDDMAAGDQAIDYADFDNAYFGLD